MGEHQDMITEKPHTRQTIWTDNYKIKHAATRTSRRGQGEQRRGGHEREVAHPVRQMVGPPAAERAIPEDDEPIEEERQPPSR